ncbi:YlbF family regulator [Miniphocaeibacter massiliensis]|uniref:YlbF family regulator n=1 Tax=Miniphocaeibacter massiliensis TaxID=2041841 RepID=UPI000C087A0B|nr:YlbF family regulator [Miniphocaeibacter massiliensis]
MDLVSKAEELGQLLANSNEYVEYRELYNSVYKNEKNKDIIDDFRKKVMEYQINYVSKGKESEDEIKKLENLQNIIMMNPEVAKFMAAEATFSVELKSVYDAIENAIKLD